MLPLPLLEGSVVPREVPTRRHGGCTAAIGTGMGAAAWCSGDGGCGTGATTAAGCAACAAAIAGASPQCLSGRNPDAAFSFASRVSKIIIGNLWRHTAHDTQAHVPVKVVAGTRRKDEDAWLFTAGCKSLLIRGMIVR